MDASRFKALLVVILLSTSQAVLAQIQIGTIKGQVLDAAGIPLPGAVATLENEMTGFFRSVASDEHGLFVFNNVPFGAYDVRVEFPGFQKITRNVTVLSNLPVNATFHLSLATNESITVEAKKSLVEPDSTSTQIRIDENRIHLNPGGTLRLQELVAEAPGLVMLSNGLLPARGVENGILYVIDGIPTSDRVDLVSSAGAFDSQMIQSLNVITGSMPAEFGGRSGAVVQIEPQSGIDQSLKTTFGAGFGNEGAAQFSSSLRGALDKRLGFVIAAAFSRSDRYLDPVDFRNFNDTGGFVKLNTRWDWHPAENDLVFFRFSINGSDFQVPNELLQERAGQSQHQELRDNTGAISWQHLLSSNTVLNFALYRESYRAKLLGSPFDTPLFASQDRSHKRLGLIGSATYSTGRHTMKAGFDASRVAPRELFSFAVTDPEAAEKREISEPALEFDTAHPFVFSGRVMRTQASFYFQDNVTLFDHLTVNAGIRYDYSQLLVSDDQLSPRIGAVYFFPGTQTALRGSFDRLYNPPQIENLLLASSEQARQLSPFADTSKPGGAAILPEKVSAYEVGIGQGLGDNVRIDLAFWRRSFRNHADPNLFFNTTIFFPNSIARAIANGVDLHLDVRNWNGWSGYVSYTNSHVVEIGPVNGGLFITDDFLEIGPGTRFNSDHDLRNTGSFAVAYHASPKDLWASLAGRYQSGVPVEVSPARLQEIKLAPGADLVDFNHNHVKPWAVFDFSAGMEVHHDSRTSLTVEIDVRNVFNKRFVYSFGNPFEGTHFGNPRLWLARLNFSFE